MKKQRYRSMLFIGLIIFTMLFTLTACGPKNDDADDPQTGQIDQGNQDSTPDPSDDKEKTNAPSQSQLTELFRKGQELKAYSYDMTFTSSYGTTVSSLWISGSDMKIQTENEGKKYTMIYGSNVSYTLDHDSKTALKYTWEDSEVEGGADFNDIQNITGDIQEDAFQFIGEETIQGEDCYIVETKDLQSDTLVKIWLHKKYGLSMRVEFTGSSPEEDVITEISNLKIGGLASDAFQVPSDYQIIEWDSSTDFPLDGMGMIDEVED